MGTEAGFDISIKQIFCLYWYSNLWSHRT